MARHSQLEGRLLAVLDVRRARTPLDFARAVTLLISTVLAVISLGVLRLAVRPEPVATASGSTVPATGERCLLGRARRSNRIWPRLGIAGGKGLGSWSRTKAAPIDDDPITIRGRVVDSAAAIRSRVRPCDWCNRPGESRNRRQCLVSWKLAATKRGDMPSATASRKSTVETKRPEEDVVVSGFKQGYGIDWDWRVNVSRASKPNFACPTRNCPSRVVSSISKAGRWPEFGCSAVTS